MKRATVVVVGGGIAGSVVAARLRADHHRVTVVDALRPNSASPAAGCVIAPSWLMGIPHNERTLALRTLYELYERKPARLTNSVGLSFSAERIEPSDILRPADIYGEVTGIKRKRVALHDGRQLEYDALVVAAGIWCSSLLDGVPDFTPLFGAALLSRAPKGFTNQLRVYAPYRQAVAVQLDSGDVWMGDGTAVSPKTWEARAGDYQDKLAERAKRYFKLPEPYRITVGARPYYKESKVGYYKELPGRVFVCSGGAKNGTVIAGLHAALVADAIRRA